MATQNIFDLSDLSDIPDAVRQNLLRKCSESMTVRSMIISVLGISDTPLHTSQIIVGIYRKFNKAIKKKTLLVVLHSMYSKKDPEIKKVSRGIYTLASNH